MIRTSTIPEWQETAVEWAASEGWNPGLHDAEAFFAADENGFYVGETEGRIISTLSGVRYPGGFAFLGFYIVRPEYRGQGHGLQIWNAVMDRLSGCVVGLDGVVAQQENYRKSGFELVHRNIRYAGSLRGEVHDLTALNEVAWEKLKAFDRRHFPDDREAFLRAWLSMPESAGFASISADGSIDGYGVIRRCREGWKIGPLFADNAGTASRLLRGLASAGDGTIYLDVPEPNRAAISLAESCGMRPMFETARMYRGGDPGLPLNRIFGITTFELG
jgi:ribosomal protein S18 acetylase RimI-like enzyme